MLAGLAGTPVSIDTAEPAVQRWALRQGIAYLNDITGFPDSSVYPDLAGAACRLVVMHAVASEGRAQPISKALRTLLKADLI